MLVAPAAGLERPAQLGARSGPPARPCWAARAACEAGRLDACYTKYSLLPLGALPASGGGDLVDFGRAAVDGCGPDPGPAPVLSFRPYTLLAPVPAAKM